MSSRLRNTHVGSGFALALVLLSKLLHGATGLIDFSQNTPNPFQGQNLPPYGSEGAFPVQVYGLIQDLYKVDELHYTFSIVFGLLLQYEDPQTVINVMNDTSEGCSFFCSSEPTDILNSAGQPACCSRAFIPGVQAINFISFEGQEIPQNYKLSVLSNSTVAYYSRTRGTFSTDLAYSSYPFDKHFLAIDFMTPFTPTLNGGAFVEATSATLVSHNKADSGYKDSTRPSLTAISLPNWNVVNTHFEVMNYTTRYGRAGQRSNNFKNDVTLSDLSGMGFRMSLEVERQTTGFYAVVEIIPVCLIVVFSFCAFALPVQNVKARFNVIASQFLTLIVLQFVLYSVLPAAFKVINPYILICVSYVMNFGMCAEVIVANWLRCRFESSLWTQRKRQAVNAYSLWRQQLLSSSAGKQTSLQDLDSAMANSLRSPPADHVICCPLVAQAEEGTPRADHAKAPQKQELPEVARSYVWEGRWLRELRLRWMFMNQPESEGYCLHVAQIFDRACLAIMAATYFITVIVLYALAAKNAQASGDGI